MITACCIGSSRSPGVKLYITIILKPHPLRSASSFSFPPSVSIIQISINYSIFIQTEIKLIAYLFSSIHIYISCKLRITNDIQLRMRSVDPYTDITINQSIYSSHLNSTCEISRIINSQYVIQIMDQSPTCSRVSSAMSIVT